MKKKIAALLSLIMLLSVMLVGCGGSAKGDGIVGTWTGEQDMTDMMNSMFAADPDMAEYLSVDRFAVTITMEFKKDETYSMTVDRDALEDTLDEFIADLSAGMEDYLAASLEDAGLEMSVEDFLAMQGMSMDDLMAEAFSEEMVDDMISEMECEGNYKVKDGELFLSAGLDYAVDPDMPQDYTIKGDTLTITDPEGGFGGFDTLTFKRVK